MDRAIEHLIEGPSYATLWTLDRKMLKAQALRAAVGARPRRVAIADAGRVERGTKRFLREVNAADGTPIKSWRELTDLWVDIANATLTETHRTPEFLEAQRRLTRSSTDCRLQEREIAEAYCEIHHIPTRTEVDELQRSVYELRRDLRNCNALHASEASMPSEATAQPSGRASHETRPRLPCARRNRRCLSASSSIAQTVREFAELSGRLVRGGGMLRSIKDRDVEIATTPKKEVFRQDKTTLYRYDPVTASAVKVPVLVVYGLVGRYTMADLQEDRSLIRNLLAQGIDLYVVDWGNPTRTDRWLTIDDFVDGYLDEWSSSFAARTAWTGSICSAFAKAACSPCAAALRPEHQESHR
jgi:hypothetical protein